MHSLISSFVVQESLDVALAWASKAEKQLKTANAEHEALQQQLTSLQQQSDVQRSQLNAVCHARDGLMAALQVLIRCDHLLNACSSLVPAPALQCVR